MFLAIEKGKNWLLKLEKIWKISLCFFSTFCCLYESKELPGTITNWDEIQFFPWFQENNFIFLVMEGCLFSFWFSSHPPIHYKSQVPQGLKIQPLYLQECKVCLIASVALKYLFFYMQNSLELFNFICFVVILGFYLCVDLLIGAFFSF